MNELLILVRALHFAVTLLAAGTVAFVALVAEPKAERAHRRLMALTWAALAFAVLSGLAWLLLVAASVLDSPVLQVLREGSLWSVLTETRFGQVWVLRFVLALLLAVLLPWPRMRALQLAAAALFAALPAWVGHAGAGLGASGAAQLAADGVHLLAAAAWLGSLPALALTLWDGWHRRMSGPDMARVTTRYSRLGMVCVAALLASGIINSWYLLGSPDALLAGDYGRLLLLKIGLFLIMVGVAAVNKWRLTPRLSNPAAVGALFRNSLVEIGLGFGVVVVVAVVGTLPPSAHVHAPQSAIPDTAAFVHIHSAEAMAEVTIDPGRATRARVRIHLMREDGTQLAARYVRLGFDPPAGGVKPPDRDAVPAADGMWEVADLLLNVPGVWGVKVNIGTAASSEILLDGPVVIEP